MKLFLFSILFFSPLAQAENLYSLETSIQVFHEFESLVEQFDSTGNPTNASTYKDIVSDYFLTLENSDYNALATYILNYYLDHPNKRKWIFDLLEFVDNRQTLIQQSEGTDNLAWSAADGAITGAFVLTLAHMGTRLSRAGIFKEGTERVLDRFFGKAVIQQTISRSRLIASPNSRLRSQLFTRSRGWLGRRLGTTWGQYGAAALAGGGIGSTLYFLRNLEEERYSLRKFLRAIHVMILSEAALATCEYYNSQSAFELSSEASLQLLDSYSQQLLDIQELDTSFNQFINGEEIVSKNSSNHTMTGSSSQKKSDTCELTTEDRIYPNAIVNQIQTFLENEE